MNKELEQEIKDSKNLPRRERRKKELMLQKNIKINQLELNQVKHLKRKHLLLKNKKEH